jgi:uridine kinase
VSRTGSARVAGNMSQLPFPPTVVGIGGCSGSGKTTLANELARLMRGLRFHLDDYYLDLSDIPLAERVEKNFDDPALIEIPLLAEHVAALARGESIERPVYDFGTYTRVRGRTQYVSAGPFLIVEGNFALFYPELFPYYHLRIYIDTPEELCFERRLKRDMDERGRTPESVRYQYEYRVRPSSVAYVRPSAANADLIVDGTGALDWKVERVMTELRKRRLLAGAG